MVGVNEASGSNTPLGAAIHAGAEAISYDQEITFTKYVKLVLPLDGFVFWVRAGLVSSSAMFNTSKFNSKALGAPIPASAPVEISRLGSLHMVTQMQQVEDETFALKRVVFTSETEIQDFEAIGPYTIYIGEFEGTRFAFSQRKSFFAQSDTFHYVGDAIYPAMESQIIDNVAQFNQDLVVSNSLPLWLNFNHYRPPYPTVLIDLPLYPSDLVPANLEPPYGAVHIYDTNALQPIPRLERNSTHWQLASEKVRITTYGVKNRGALDFQDMVIRYTQDNETFGIMNTPIFRDEKRVQSELSMIAMKKTIEFEIDYYQNTARDIARQLILSCIPTFTFSDSPLEA